MVLEEQPEALTFLKGPRTGSLSHVSGKPTCSSVMLDTPVHVSACKREEKWIEAEKIKVYKGRKKKGVRKKAKGEIEGA